MARYEKKPQRLREFHFQSGETYINISYFQTPNQMTGRFGDFGDQKVASFPPNLRMKWYILAMMKAVMMMTISATMVLPRLLKQLATTQR